MLYPGGMVLPVTRCRGGNSGRLFVPLACSIQGTLFFLRHVVRGHAGHFVCSSWFHLRNIVLPRRVVRGTLPFTPFAYFTRGTLFSMTRCKERLGPISRLLACLGRRAMFLRCHILPCCDRERLSPFARCLYSLSSCTVYLRCLVWEGGARYLTLY